MQFSVQNFWYFTRAKHSKDDKSTHFSLNPPQPNFVSITETRSFAASITDLFHAFQTHERETWHLRCCEQPCWWRWQDIDMFLWADSRLSCRRNKHRLLFKMTPILPEMISTERDRTVCELQLACLQLGTSQTPVTSNSFTSLLLLQRCGENTCLLTGPHCPPPPSPRWYKNENGELVKWYWLGRTEGLGEKKTVPVPLYTPQIPHWQSWI